MLKYMKTDSDKAEFVPFIPQVIASGSYKGQEDVKPGHSAADLKGLSMGTLPVGGFGLTTIAKADWEAIRRIVQDWALFRNGLLFAHDKPADVTAEADEKAELRHGREPVEVNGGTRQSQSVPADMASA